MATGGPEKKEGENVVNASGTANPAPGGASDLSSSPATFTPGHDAKKAEEAAAAKTSSAASNDAPARNKKKCSIQ
ncbi:MAG: hypothetical protein JSR17_10555 [Proteobacteria bacterium]|nr:hypothetical protein [Pseudomonadota bacterium]